MVLSNDQAAALCRQPTPEGLVTFYDWINKDEDPNTKITFPDHLWPVAQALCDLRINNLMLQVGPGSGKSFCLSQVYPAWLLGLQPTTTIMTISGSEGLAGGFLGSVMTIIERSRPYRLCFPTVTPDKTRAWSAGSGIFVNGARIGQSDSSYSAYGLSSKELTGKHGQLIILDDIHDEANSSTKENCIKVTNTYSSQLVGRADPMGARFLLAGRRWSVHDLYGTLERSGGWVVMRLPAERPGGTILYYDVYVPEGLDCVFTDNHIQTPDGRLIEVGTRKVPEPQPLERSNRMLKLKWPYGRDPQKQGFFWPASPQKRREYFEQKHLNPSVTKAVYQCDPASVETEVFIPQDFDRRFPAPDELELGRANSPTVNTFCKEGTLVVSAWDTAFSSSKSSDYSVCVTALLVYNDQYRNGEDADLIGPCEPHYIVRILDVRREKLTFAQVVRQIRSEYMRWLPNAIVIENKAYGVAAIESLSAAGLPIEAVTPEASKRTRAVEGLGAGSAQGWFRQGRVEFPSPEPPWFEKLREEMLDFTGDPGKADDQVDAVVHLIRWAIMEGTGAILPAGWTSVDEVNEQMTPARALGFNPFTAEQDASPFDGTCTSCTFFDSSKSFCTRHRQKTVALGSCEHHQVNSAIFKPILPDMAGFKWAMLS
jgi:predicted phage terminase large subunit-like protein